MSDVVERLLAAKEFLRGAAPWDGIWFNESKVDAINRVHRWWWRKDCLPVLDEAAAELQSHRARWSRLCALVMTDHRGDGLPTQEVTPDQLIAFIERLIAERDAPTNLQKMQISPDAVAAERERCARVAETWDSGQADSDDRWSDGFCAGEEAANKGIAAAIRKGDNAP